MNLDKYENEPTHEKMRRAHISGHSCCDAKGGARCGFARGVKGKGRKSRTNK